MTNLTNIVIRQPDVTARDIERSNKPIGDIATIFNNYFSIAFSASIFNSNNLPAAKCASIIDNTNLTNDVCTNILNHSNLGLTKKNAILAISVRW